MLSYYRNRTRTLVRGGNKARDVGNYSKAKEMYRDALREDPTMEPIWVQYGHSAKECGELIEAEVAYRRAISLNDRNADTHLHLAHLLKRLGKMDEARQAFSNALACDPTLSEAREELDASRHEHPPAPPPPPAPASEPGPSYHHIDVRACVSMSVYEAEAQMRARCSCAYLGGNRTLARVFGRYLMFLDTRDIGFAPHLMFDGFWEIQYTKFLISQIKPGDTVVDIGANFGYYTLIFSDCVGEAGKCIAFEPNPLIATELRRSLSLNGFGQRSDVREIALSDCTGEAPLVVPRGEPKNGFLRASPVTEMSDTGDVFGILVDTGDLQLGDETRIDLIKIDAEGAEAGIVTGLSKIMDRHHPRIMIEINANRDYDTEGLLNTLTSIYGPAGSIAEDGSLAEVSIDKVLNERRGLDWLLFFGNTRNSEKGDRGG
jgi:FkbM family methyltransferase